MRAEIKRPVAENYLRFMERFVSGLKEHPDVSFYGFGSYTDGRRVFGNADIDGFLVLPGEVVSDKVKVRDISEILAKALKRNPVGVQLNLLDLESGRDGRFVSYTEDYTEFLKRNAVLFSGPEVVNQLRGFYFKSGILYSGSFNFCGPGGVRNTALHVIDYLQNPQVHFEARVQAALDKVCKFPKKLLILINGDIVSCRHASQRRLEGILGEIDYDKLTMLNQLFDNPAELDRRLNDSSENVIGLLYEGLELMEQMVSAYIRRFPEIGKREVGQ
jgi:hypothetical protein